METRVQHQKQLQYAEVYISDMLELKEIFLRAQNTATVHKDFGIPFLLAKEKDNILSFASLVINEQGEIECKAYHRAETTEPEKRIFDYKSEEYCQRNTTANFRNPEQLKRSIESMVSWLNF
ncbi:hypothetical protein [Chryseobacterium sp.]|uniref:hypothetical protein n=1 Tax=Chryseobacterium sp. TaxID=1871047 RepID=UPI0025C1C102|nr:hypothetical protein [Chryseobacterium sp.]MBV8327146.1 hypothetical protein [Chryseobacterium sp.]